MPLVVVSESGLSFLIISRDRGIFGLSWGVEVKVPFGQESEVSAMLEDSAMSVV